MRRIWGFFLGGTLILALLLPSPGVAGNLCPQLRGLLVRGGGRASGLYVLDATSGRPVCARAPGRRRPLASNMKLFTTSTALARFGPAYRIETALLSDGALDEEGVLHGSLYLRGGGDPTLGVPSFYDRYLGGFGTNLLALKRGLREAGVRRVTGRLYADDTIFDRLRGVADSGYATSPWIGPLSGLSFDSGYAANGFAADPAKLAAETLDGALRRVGIAIRPGVALGTTPPGAQTLAAVRSPTMSHIVATTDVDSDNFFAETLLKLIGARFGGEGSTRAGARVVAAFARAHGSAVHAVDGSGLTRGNRASPRQVVDLLEAMRESPLSEAFEGDLALAGREGTVSSRMHGSAAEGRCRLKTGTLTGV
ncbi:MAG TPA: D-alanyl-D-alanine carboxypeptidase, partial [Solirubrobacterales bacterium]|nr:D-alanyl-D-alanine carboxypeptidase [Solirubrobacterales bacterium]